MRLCCCCRRSNAKADNVDDDSADASDPLITEAETDKDEDNTKSKNSESQERPGIIQYKSVGDIVDISDRSLSQIDDGIPELAHNPEVMHGRAVGDLQVRESMMDSSITEKVPREMTKKVSFAE